MAGILGDSLTKDIVDRSINNDKSVKILMSFSRDK